MILRPCLSLRSFSVTILYSRKINCSGREGRGEESGAGGGGEGRMGQEGEGRGGWGRRGRGGEGHSCS